LISSNYQYAGAAIRLVLHEMVCGVTEKMKGCHLYLLDGGGVGCGGCDMKMCEGMDGYFKVGRASLYRLA